MVTSEGIEFINAEPETVIDHLKNLKRSKIKIGPSNLTIKNDGKLLILSVMNNGVKEYPIRRAFLYKLLKWYSFPIRQLQRLSNETVISICNDFLLNISRDYVTVTFENDEALTITSPKYNEVTDIEVIKKCADLKIQNISRNDFFLRIITEDKYKFQVVPGDTCGIGMSVVNSETGFRALSVSHYILRYICTNGAMIKIDKENNQKIHYGYNDDELKLFLDQQIRNAVSNQKQIADSIINLSANAASDHIGKVKKRVESFLGRNEAKIILSKVMEDANLYELFNVITESAKRDDLSKRIYLESLAGELILN